MAQTFSDKLSLIDEQIENNLSLFYTYAFYKKFRKYRGGL